jgi:hypothetical protein
LPGLALLAGRTLLAVLAVLAVDTGVAVRSIFAILTVLTIDAVLTVLAVGTVGAIRAGGSLRTWLARRSLLALHTLIAALTTLTACTGVAGSPIYAVVSVRAAGGERKNQTGGAERTASLNRHRTAAKRRCDATTNRYAVSHDDLRSRGWQRTPNKHIHVTRSTRRAVNSIDEPS